MWRAQVGDGFHPLVPEASQPSFLHFNDIINHTPLFVIIKSQLNLYLLGAKQSVHNAIYFYLFIFCFFLFLFFIFFNFFS